MVMKGKLLPWLLLMFLISSLAITNSSFQLEHHQDDVDVSMLQGHETIHGERTVEVVRLNEVNESAEDYGRGSNKEGDLVVSAKGQKGNGGANAASRPRQEKSSSAAPRPSLFAKTMLNVSFSLVLILSFKVL